MLPAIFRRLTTARALWRRFVLDDKGSLMTLLAAVPVIAGSVAVGIETGELYRIRRQMQISADAAALAASIDVAANRTSSAVTDGRYEAQRNGFADGVNNVTVTVNVPPTTGTHQGAAGAAEVIITRQSNFSLGAVLLNWIGHSNAGFT